MTKPATAITTFRRLRATDRSERADGFSVAQGRSIRKWAHTSTDRQTAQNTAKVAIPPITPRA
ncbi:MAG: hypothetical protein U0599_29870 [Vicinamibacteria bacterium]